MIQYLTYQPIFRNGVSWSFTEKGVEARNVTDVRGITSCLLCQLKRRMLTATRGAEEPPSLIWCNVWVSRIISNFEQNLSLSGTNLCPRGPAEFKNKVKGTKRTCSSCKLLDVILNDDTWLTGSIIRPTRFNAHDSALLLFGRWFGHLPSQTSILICPALSSTAVCVCVCVCVFAYLL